MFYIPITLHMVVKESFDLYRDVSSGVALLLDSFFHLQHQSCVAMVHACVKASKQFEELYDFYSICKSVGVGRLTEYPSAHKISDELIETLQGFLKDQPSLPSDNGKSPGPSEPSDSPLNGSIQSPSRSRSSDSNYEIRNRNVESEVEERGSNWGSQCTSLEVQISATEAACVSNLNLSGNNDQEKESPRHDDLISIKDTGSDRGSNPSIDGFAYFDPWPQERERQQQPKLLMMSSPSNEATDCWELALFETAPQSRPDDNPAFAVENHTNQLQIDLKTD